MKERFRCVLLQNLPKSWAFLFCPAWKIKEIGIKRSLSANFFFFFSGQRRNLSMKNNMQIVNEWERASVSALGPRARWTEACMGDFSYLVWAKRLGKPWNYLVRKPGSSGQGGCGGRKWPFQASCSVFTDLRSSLEGLVDSQHLPQSWGKVIKGLKFACNAIDIQTHATPLHVTEKIKAVSFQSFRLKMEEWANM